MNFSPTWNTRYKMLVSIKDRYTCQCIFPHKLVFLLFLLISSSFSARSINHSEVIKVFAFFCFATHNMKKGIKKRNHKDHVTQGIFFCNLQRSKRCIAGCQKNCPSDTPCSQLAMQQNAALHVAGKVELSSTFRNAARQVAANNMQAQLATQFCRNEPIRARLSMAGDFKMAAEESVVNNESTTTNSEIQLKEKKLNDKEKIEFLKDYKKLPLMWNPNDKSQKSPADKNPSDERACWETWSDLLRSQATAGLLEDVNGKGNQEGFSRPGSLFVYTSSCVARDIPYTSGFCGSKLHMIKCRGARAADGS